MSSKPSYRRLRQIGVQVKPHPSGDCSYVAHDELNVALKQQGISDLFDRYFGVQTVCDLGPYPGDVEAVLERIFSGKLLGSQLDWD